MEAGPPCTRHPAANGGEGTWRLKNEPGYGLTPTLYKDNAIKILNE
jgi:hypothetical protein